MAHRSGDRLLLEAGSGASSSPNAMQRLVVAVLSGVLTNQTHRFNSTRQGTSQYFYNPNIDLDQKEFGGLVPLFIKIIRTLLRLIFWMLIGGCTYAFFFNWMMPRQVVHESLSFDYVPRQTNECSLAENNEISTRMRRDFEEFSYDNRCVAWIPSASLNLFAKHNSWQALHEDITPAPKTKHRLLNPGQAYYIDLALELPESKQNRDNGVFRIAMDLISHNNQTALASVKFSARLPHESTWIATVRKLVLLPALLLGAVDESRTLHFILFRHFTENKEFPLQYVSLQIFTRDLDSIVEVNKGVLRICEEMSRSQELLKKWYYTCFLIGSVVFMIIDYLLLLLWRALLDILRQKLFAMREPFCEIEIDESEEIFDDPLTDYEPWFVDDCEPTNNLHENEGRESNGNNFDEDHSTSVDAAHFIVDHRSATFTCESLDADNQSAGERSNESSNSSWKDL